MTPTLDNDHNAPLFSLYLSHVAYKYNITLKWSLYSSDAAESINAKLLHSLHTSVMSRYIKSNNRTQQQRLWCTMVWRGAIISLDTMLLDSWISLIKRNAHDSHKHTLKSIHTCTLNVDNYSYTVHSYTVHSLWTNDSVESTWLVCVYKHVTHYPSSHPPLLTCKLFPGLL